MYTSVYDTRTWKNFIPRSAITYVELHAPVYHMSISLFITLRSLRPKHRFAGGFGSRRSRTPDLYPKRLLSIFFILFFSCIGNPRTPRAYARGARTACGGGARGSHARCGTGGVAARRDRPTRLVLQYGTAVNLVLYIPWYRPTRPTRRHVHARPTRRHVHARPTRRQKKKYLNHRILDASY
jgi:hypothetical protein